MARGRGARGEAKSKGSREGEGETGRRRRHAGARLWVKVRLPSALPFLVQDSSVLPELSADAPISFSVRSRRCWNYRRRFFFRPLGFREPSLPAFLRTQNRSNS